MLLKDTRFAAIMLAALTLGLGFCHLMQLPSRLGWDQYLWVGSTVQGGVYAMFGSVGAVIFAATVIALGLNAYFTREHGRPGFRLALAAAALFAPVPADWTDYRARWEWGHAIIAAIELLGFAALIGSVLADTPSRTR